ncbi:T-cell surface glycoprotein CD8 beta chain-like [Stegastes partitus]|uniref:T-cell surface glycoprotein CD8 beta chain-like n=1 Tax=Stegastes partitus TaxID=144197 RepID=A0A9Y4KAC1_9TELE|nr:PREDICTED: T-cell surface glycoprotein CD8 beta chain-like [Stegastes partitus]
MRNSALATVLLLHSLGWISVLAAEFRYVEAQPGENVTLLCSNFSNVPTHIIWHRAVKRSKFSCVSSMFKASEPDRLCEGVQRGKFEMTSNMSTVFLSIKHVDLSDSGLYFCGYMLSKNPVVVDATNLEVQDVLEGLTKLMSVILGALTVFLATVTVCLAVKIKKLLKAHAEEQEPRQMERKESDDLNYASVTFIPKPERRHKPAKEREADCDVIYSATR